MEHAGTEKRHEENLERLETLFRFLLPASRSKLFRHDGMETAGTANAKHKAFEVLRIVLHKHAVEDGLIFNQPYVTFGHSV